MSVTVTVDISRMRRELRQLGDKAPLAAARALNRSIASVQTATTRALASDLNLAQKDVRKALSLKRATRQTLRATLTVTGRRIALSAFKARQTLRGVTYSLGARGRGLLPSGFLATMRSGHVGVFKRRGTARLPIDERFGPSLPHVFTQARIAEARVRLANDLMQKNLTHEVDFLVTGLRKAS